MNELNKIKIDIPQLINDGYDAFGYQDSLIRRIQTHMT